MMRFMTLSFAFMFLALPSFGSDGYQYQNDKHDFEYFSSLTVSERKSVYPELPTKIKTTLWMNHLEQKIAENDFNETQVAFILYWMDLLENGFLEHQKDDLLYDLKVEKPMAALKEKALELFSAEEVFLIFMMIGPYNPDEGVEATYSSKFIPECNCRWFCWPTNCIKKPGNLTFCRLADGLCGWGGTEACDGLCG